MIQGPTEISLGVVTNGALPKIHPISGRSFGSDMLLIGPRTRIPRLLRLSLSWPKPLRASIFGPAALRHTSRSDCHKIGSTHGTIARSRWERLRADFRDPLEIPSRMLINAQLSSTFPGLQVYE